MNSLFSDLEIEAIKRTKRIFLWTAVSILIGEVVVSAFLILIQNLNEMTGRLMGTFAACAIMMFFGVNNFSRMEKGDRVIQSFALISLIGNIIWLLFSFLFIWDIVPFTESMNKYPFLYLTGVAKIFLVAINIAIMCFLISNIWSIKETLKPVRPLKITAILCALYCGIYLAIMTVGDVQSMTDRRWHALAGLAGLAFIVMSIAAVIVSYSGGKKDREKTNAGVDKTGKADVQVTIQEMVEKEVQERLAAERKKAEIEAMPPLQDENMMPTVSHDNNVNVSNESDVNVPKESEMSVSNKNVVNEMNENIDEISRPIQDGDIDTSIPNDEIADSFDKGEDSSSNKETLE